MPREMEFDPYYDVLDDLPLARRQVAFRRRESRGGARAFRSSGQRASGQGHLGVFPKIPGTRIHQHYLDAVAERS